MSIQRTTRSTRSDGNSLAATDHPSDMKPTTRARPYPITKEASKASSPVATRSKRRAAGREDVETESALDGSALDEEATKEDDQAEPSDQPDVQAPSSGATSSHVDLQPAASSQDVKQPWTGPSNKDVNNNVINSNETNVPISVKPSIEKDHDGDEIMSISGSDSDESSPDFEPNVDEDDDNYDDVDQISNASEGSEAFEKEVEREIIAEGEDGIDWNDDSLFRFDYSFAASAYSSAVEFGMFDYDFALYGLEPEGNPSGNDTRNENNFKPPVTMEEAMSLVSSQTSKSTSKTSSRRGSQSFSGASVKSTRSFELNDEDMTDNEEPPQSTVDSPAITLTKTLPKSTKKRRARTKIITDATPRKHGLKLPVMRRMPTDPNKAVAFCHRTPWGKIFNFINKAIANGHTESKLIRIRSTPSSTAPNSPTVIDLQAALGGGNTNTGAYLTDVINGRLFQQYHCGLGEDLIIDNQVLATEFARNTVTRRRRSVSFPMNYALETPNGSRHNDPAFALIDLDAGIKNEENSRASTPSPRDSAMDLDAGIPNVVESIEMPATTSTKSSSHDEPIHDGAPPTPTTPRPSDSFLHSESVAHNKRKRRGSTASGESRRSTTPYAKRQRIDLPSEVAV